MTITTCKYAYIHTFGCQMNEHDSAKMGLILADMGYLPTDSPEAADLVLFNTCTIREKAHHKAMSEIGRMRLIKKRRPEMLLGVCGCVAQQEKLNLLEAYPYIDIIFGPDQIHKLPELIKEAELKKRSTALELVNDEEKYVFLTDPLLCKEGVGGGRSNGLPLPTLPLQRGGKYSPSSFISIMKGCNCACSYCIVPSVRGREVCRPAGEILDEIKNLVRLGTREAVLLGQNVNAYHSRKSSGGGDIGFARLIRMISDETGVDRIRFMSPHPKDVGDDLIREFSENEKLCPHIHLPIQSGSNSTLKRMRRGYTRERIIEIADRLRGARPDFAITTDMIVGFCQETGDDFEQTIELMKRIEFDSMFAFKYSPRPGTEAARAMEDDVPESEKKGRLSLVLDLQREITLRRNTARVGTTKDVLALSPDRTRDGFLTGRSPDNSLVHFSGNSSLIGDIVRVRITKANKNSLSGELHS